jgi:DNA-binding GntR family transcriptional regulator
MRRRPDLPLDVLTIDRASKDPLHRQLYGPLRQVILSGMLPSGFCLPPSRTLACQLAVGRNTVVTAYEQLASEGYLDARSGTGTRVAAVPAPEAIYRPIGGLNLSGPLRGMKPISSLSERMKRKLDYGSAKPSIKLRSPRMHVVR